MTYVDERAEVSNNGTCLHDLTLKHRSGVTIAAVKPLFSHDSQSVFIANGPDVKVFSIKSGECILTMKYHTTPIIGLEENKNNILQIYSCSGDGVVVRWDYTGRVLQVYKLGVSVVSFYAPYAEDRWFVTREHENHYRLYTLIPESDDYSLKLIRKPVLPAENAVDFSVEHKFVASVYENTLNIYLLKSKVTKKHITGKRNLTCVVCHPFNAVLATGDDQGRVILWSEALYNYHPMKSIYHWHTLPVADLAFSSEGSHIYSGGGESVLVKWNLFSEERNFLPRLGAPIQRIIASKDNNFVMTTHSDNVLQVINAQRNIVQVIQGLTRSSPIYGKILPIGLLYNAHLKTLVMNGKPGHLQFFDLKQGKLMFNLDIASKNLMSQDRAQDVYNIDIHKGAMDDEGLWLATSEYWCNNEVSPHIWLKFWGYDMEKQMFALNTNVYLPHSEDLNCIIFRPSNSITPPIVVTTSNDHTFKIWTLNTIPSESKQSWGCEFVGNYRDLIPTSASFSEDGSVLAVAFGSAATLWMTNNLTLKAVLYEKKSETDIKQLLFGRHAGLKYLITHNGLSITIWDCSSLSIHVKIYYEIQTLVADPYSDNIAAFCKDQNLKIFKPSNPEPLDFILKASDVPVVSGVFVPSSTPNGITGCFKDKSQLYFMDTNQNLITVTEADDEEEVGSSDKRTVAQNLAETPFGLLQAQQIISHVKPAKIEQFNISSKKDSNIISNPTWQDPEALLKAILPNLLVKEGEETPQEEAMSTEENTNDDKESIVSVDPLQANEDSLSKALQELEVKWIDFGFLSESVQFDSV